MPYRAANIVLAALGCVAVIALLLLGADALRAAESGPRWKRRLLGAGLVLLAAMGLSSCSRADAPGTQPVQAAGPATTPAAALEETPEWKTILEGWKALSPLITTDAQLKVTEDQFARVNAAAEDLARSGQITPSEKLILLNEAARLRQEGTVNYKIATTCYDSMLVAPAPASLKRLSDRLPLLRQLAVGGALHPAVMAKVLPSVEEDLRWITDEKSLKAIPDAEREQAEKVRTEAAKLVTEIKAAVEKAPAPAAPAPKASLEETPEWKALTAAWKDAERATSGPVMDYPFDEAGKKKILAGLATASESVGALEGKGLLSAAEADLLRKELASLTGFVRWKREKSPDGMYGTCYDMAYIPTPPVRSVHDLSEQLPLLEKLATEKKLDAPAVRRILETVQAQLAALGKEGNAELRAKVAAAVERIKAAVGDKAVLLDDLRRSGRGSA